MPDKLHWIPQSMVDQWWGCEKSYESDDSMPKKYVLLGGWHTAVGGKDIADWEVTIDGVLIRCTDVHVLRAICDHHHERGRFGS